MVCRRGYFGSVWSAEYETVLRRSPTNLLVICNVMPEINIFGPKVKINVRRIKSVEIKY